MTSNWTPIVNVELLDFNCWVGLFVVFFGFFLVYIVTCGSPSCMCDWFNGCSHVYTADLHAGCYMEHQ